MIILSFKMLGMCHLFMISIWFSGLRCLLIRWCSGVWLVWVLYAWLSTAWRKLETDGAYVVRFYGLEAAWLHSDLDVVEHFKKPEAVHGINFLKLQGSKIPEAHIILVLIVRLFLVFHLELLDHGLGAVRGVREKRLMNLALNNLVTKHFVTFVLKLLKFWVVLLGLEALKVALRILLIKFVKFFDKIEVFVVSTEFTKQNYELKSICLEFIFSMN